MQNYFRSYKYLAILIALCFVVSLFVGTTFANENEEQFKRLYGDNRYETAVEIAKYQYESADAVVLARGDVLYDALSGSVLAAQLDAPVLLTQTGSLPAVTKDAISDLGASKVYILGGEAAVSAAVADELVAEGLEVERISDADRYSTAAAIAEKVAELMGEDFPTEAFIVSGDAVPDALTVSPYAAMNGMPILLVREDSVPEATSDAIDALGLEDFTIIGGPAVVSDAVQNDLDAERIWGENRHKTGAAVASEYFSPTEEVPGSIIFASGHNDNLVDAMAGGYFGAKQEGPILYTTSLDDDVMAYMSAVVTEQPEIGVYVLGGTAAVSEAKFDDIKDLFPEPLELGVIESVESASVSVEYGTALADALDMLPDELEATLTDATTVDVGVDWAEETDPEYDAEAPGEYSVEGTLVDLPEGVTNPEEVTASATITVEEQEILEVVSVEPVTRSVPWGTSEDDALAMLPGEVTANLDDDSSVEVNVEWDDEIPGYDAETEGEYSVEGELVDLPEGVENPGEEKASATITVEPLVAAFVSDGQQFVHEIETETGIIVLENSITLPEAPAILRVRTDGLRIMLNGFTVVNLANAIAFEGDGIRVENGTFAQPHPPSHILSPEDFPWGEIDVMVDGTGVDFDTVTFNAFFKDWYQEQDEHAEGLYMVDCTFNLPALFESDVHLDSANINAAVGVRNDDAVLDNPVLRPNPVHTQRLQVDEGTVTTDRADDDEHGWTGYTQGMLYITGDIDLNNPHLNRGFTGFYVGKDLKYYGETSKTEVTMTDGKVTSNKYEQSWIALQHPKAELIINGEVVVDVELAGPAIVGRGLIKGNATFTEGNVYPESNVYLGWQSEDFVDWYRQKFTPAVLSALYGDYEFGDCEDDAIQREKATPIYADYQLACKTNCYITIHGPTFDSDVYIFDSLTEEQSNVCRVFPLGGVMFGDVKLGDVKLWGNFTIVDNKVVEFDEIKLECGKHRAIFAHTTGTTLASEPPDCWKDRGEPVDVKGWYYGNSIKGTLQGGTILTDTKPENVLVFGDNLRVQDVILDEYLYDVMVRSTTLERVQILTGDEVRVVRNSDATFEDVMWSGDTHIWVACDSDAYKQAKLTFAGEIDNQGSITFGKYAAISFAEGVTFTQTDPRDDHSTEISQTGDGYVYIDVNRAATPGWTFDNWKNDVIIGSDARMISAIYQFRVYSDVYGDPGYQDYYFDLTDPDNYPWVTENGINDEWLTTILGEERDFFGTSSIRVRIASMEAKTFDLSAAGWMLNCCTETQISLDSDDQEVSVAAKPGVFPEEACFWGWIETERPLVAGEPLIAEWWVSNIGGEEAAQDVTRTLTLKYKGPPGDDYVKYSWTGSETLTLGPGDTNNFNTTNRPTDSGSWEAEAGDEFILTLETECRTYTVRIPVVAPE